MMPVLRPGEKLLPRLVGQEAEVCGIRLRVLSTKGGRVWLGVTPPAGETVVKLEEEELALMASDA